MTSPGPARRTFLAAAGVAAVAAVGSSSAEAKDRDRRRTERLVREDAARAEMRLHARRQPNVVLIMADDMGFSDIGAFGSEIDTPHLDRIAAEGTTFTAASNNARCSPTRASILTGLYPTQVGVGWSSDDRGEVGYEGYLNGACHTFGERLQAAGYATSLYGKWHVGKFGTEVVPQNRGFAHSYGPQGGRSSYFAPNLYEGLRDAGTPTTPGYYLTDALTYRAVREIRARAAEDAPFLTYVTYTAPHFPLQALPADVARFRARYRAGWDTVRERRFARQRALGLLPSVRTLPPRDDASPSWDVEQDRTWQVERMAVYAAQVAALDRGVGKILAELDRTGVADDTVVMFLSDNGAASEALPSTLVGTAKVPVAGAGRMAGGNSPDVMPGPADTYASYGRAWANVSNTPFDLFKRNVHEGGVATPLLVRWPGHTRPGSRDSRAVHVIDVMPTLLEIAGATYPPTRDGVAVPPPEGDSLVPALDGRGSDVATWDDGRWLFWEHEGGRAVRHGRWKAVAEDGEEWSLYDMYADRAEQVDLALSRPALVSQYVNAWHAWADRVGVRTWDDAVAYDEPSTVAPEEAPDPLARLRA